MQEGSWIYDQPMLKNIYKTPPINDEGNHLKTYSLDQNLEGTYYSAATAKTRREVRAGLLWSFL